LDVLASRARWPARIPLNSKASFDGDVVHPDQLHVHVGGEWWVEMSAAEAAAYVRRRKAGECSVKPLLGRARADASVSG
jgi:hypothetical protein